MFLRRLLNEDLRLPSGVCDGLRIEINDDGAQLVGKVIQAFEENCGEAEEEDEEAEEGKNEEKSLFEIGGFEFDSID